MHNFADCTALPPAGRLLNFVLPDGFAAAQPSGYTQSSRRTLIHASVEDQQLFQFDVLMV